MMVYIITRTPKQCQSTHNDIFPSITSTGVLMNIPTEGADTKQIPTNSYEQHALFSNKKVSGKCTV